jgi:D-sedoheptulose 7-phosphate isomerase
MAISWKSYKRAYFKAAEEIDTAAIDRLVEILIESYEGNKTVFIIGNGGSASAATHFCNDLNIGTLWNKQSTAKRFRSISLTDNISVMTAWANDTDYEDIFEQQLRNLANPGDLLIAISGSGKSPNIIKAVDYANSSGLYTVGLSGFDGGKLKEKSAFSVHVPLDDMGMVEAVHSMILHYIPRRLREELKIQ